MTIHKAKASNYTSVTSENVASYIKQYANKILLASQNPELSSKNKTQLKAIAAELETVCKRFDYILEGRY